MKKLTLLGITLTLLLGLVLSAFGLTTRAAAEDAIFIVTSNDEAELRIAIEKADVAYVLSGGTAANTITFAPNVTGTITLTTGELVIKSNLTIIGPGANLLTISGNNASRVFYISPDNISRPVTVTLEGLTVAGGNGVGATNTGNGGGILNDGSTLTLNNCTVSDNTSVFNAGGISNSGGTLSLNNCTVSGNSAGGNGGGILSQNNGTVTLTNSTVSDNATATNGGGILNGGMMKITNSTVTGNRADSDGDALGSGGGIAPSGTETLNNTIVAGNFVGTGTTPDDIIITFGTIDTASNNLIGDAATAGGIANGVNSNKVGNGGVGTLDINTLLDTTLANNGGPTLTHRLKPNSPALDAGSDALAVDAANQPLTTDQRGTGFPRTLDGNADTTAVVDIGSFEQSTYNFTGFFQPVDNAPIVNSVNAGQAIPVKFSLGGNQGLAIFAPGYPASQPISCNSGNPTDVIEETVTAGSSSLSYDATTGQYKYTWKTEKAWKGTCRKLVLTFSDGSTRFALFQFK